MKITIDLAYLKRVKLNVNEYLTLMVLNSPDKQIPYTPQKADILSLHQKEIVNCEGSNLQVLQRGSDILDGVVELRPYEELVEELRVLYPSGKKDGKYPWRGFSKDIHARLRKLDKNAGLDKYSNTDLTNAVKEYVAQFTPQTMDKGMQLLQYFIEKDGNSSLIAWLESDDKESIVSSPMTMRL